MPLQFQAELTPQLVREATAGIFWRQVAKPTVVAGALVLLLIAQALVWLLIPTHLWQLHAGLALLMAASVGMALAFANRYYQDLALRNFQRFRNAPASVRLDEDAYRYQADWGSGSVEWTRFQSLWCLRNVWVLLQHSEQGVSVLLPAGALDEEARAFLRRKLGGQGARVVG